jgi:putative ABC transport system substrate-binding protein
VKVAKDELNKAAAQLGVELRNVVVSEKASVSEFRAAVGAARVNALMTGMLTPQLIEYLITAKMPACGVHFKSVKQGMPLAMSFDWQEGEQQAVAMAASILKGADPATTPVYRHKRYLMALNRSTARAIGLTIPDSILLQADEIFD